jgi:hypothetical protein
MKISLIETNGYGLEARIMLNGVELIVMDGISIPEADPALGEIDNVEFSCLDGLTQTWEGAFQGNPNEEMKLEHVAIWKYRAYGKITSIDPTTIDTGLLKLEAGPRTNDKRCIGEYVMVEIDRLDITPKE